MNLAYHINRLTTTKVDTAYLGINKRTITYYINIYLVVDSN